MVASKYPKPHATFREHGVKYVKAMVSEDVRLVLELMELNRGAIIKISRSRSVLSIAGQPDIKIDKQKAFAVCDWLKLRFGEPEEKWYELPEETLEYIRSMERSGR